MGTTKAKVQTAGRSKKSAAITSPVKRVKTKSAQSVLGEEEIRLKAIEIYNERIARGEEGDAEEDWLKAEKLLKG
jgi:hypothetical protein